MGHEVSKIDYPAIIANIKNIKSCGIRENKLTELIKTKKIDFEHKYENGQNLLHVLVHHKTCLHELARIIISIYKNNKKYRHLIDATDDDLRTPLMYAHDDRLITELISAGANLNHQDKYGNSVLLDTFKEGQWHCVNESKTLTLIDCKADIDLPNNKNETIMSLNMSYVPYCKTVYIVRAINTGVILHVIEKNIKNKKTNFLSLPNTNQYENALEKINYFHESDIKGMKIQKMVKNIYFDVVRNQLNNYSGSADMYYIAAIIIDYLIGTVSYS
jgi:hypothetical protein